MDGKQSSVQRAAALFLLKTTEEHKLPLSAMNSLVLDIKLLVSRVVDEVALKAKEILSNEDSERLCTELNQEGIQNPFCGLSTDYQLVEYCKGHLGLVVSCLSAMLFTSYFVLTFVLAVSFTASHNTLV